MPNNSKYIYIGKFFHRKGRELDIPEKKIGLTRDLKQREYELGRTKSPIGYTIVAAWDTGAYTETVEKQIHALLKHDRAAGEWFDDEDDDLIARVTEFMRLGKYPEVPLEKEDDADANSVREAEKNHVELVELRKEHLDWLVGESFSYTCYGTTVTVIAQPDGKFRCEQNGKTYPTLNSAFQKAGIELSGRDTFPINAWKGPRNTSGKSPDDVLQEKHETAP